ncbi:hypothetical protein MPC4_330012 [Methylocella tundrae]|uniref:Uncharacterized protein n=1 Tax=Methylocella tundrae TaxID=227605 RepID=A0A8B6MAV6_METTU|nr:hypothetical protein MPC1_3420003 [Methylocella tundrae]VTZ51212.1 hypothetical protein MPC4_330012 [Methylocella tundrae]
MIIDGDGLRRDSAGFGRLALRILGASGGFLAHLAGPGPHPGSARLRSGVHPGRLLRLSRGAHMVIIVIIVT